MTKTDKLIFWSVLLSAVFLLLFSNVIFAKTGRETIVIELGGKEYARYQQDALSQPKTLEIQTEFGYNKIEVSKRGARVIDSDCKDRQCIGEIQKSGEMMVCLPHRLIVKIEGSGEVDGVAY